MLWLHLVPQGRFAQCHCPSEHRASVPTLALPWQLFPQVPSLSVLAELEYPLYTARECGGEPQNPGTLRAQHHQLSAALLSDDIDPTGLS